MRSEIDNREVDKLTKKLNQEVESSGYHLNPDTEFTKDLINSLLMNEKRYGYRACPCRLASGNKSEDLDIICPCDYRDADLNEYGMCYCALYVSKDVVDGKQKIQPIPERRPINKKKIITPVKSSKNISSLSKPVWRCRVCGYLCARDKPPEVCPICKVRKERFERFM